MKKVFYSAIALSLLAGSATYAQNVGIGTATPASKLTVNGNASFGTGFTGIAAPANGAIIQGNLGVGTSAPGAKLHVLGNGIFNAAITGAASKNALDINVGEDGFFYGNRGDDFGINFRTSSTSNGGPISRINFGDGGTGPGNNGNRYMSFSVGNPLNELMFLSSISGGMIGIGTITPAAKLDITGTLKVADGTQGAGKVLTSDANGLASWQTPAGGPAAVSYYDWLKTGDAQPTAPADNAGNVYHIGNVGIGNNAPTEKLDVTGNAKVTGNATVSGNVGIGTLTPAAKLDVAGNVKIADGTQGAGKLLVSDANGVASWQSPAQTKEIISLASSGQVGILSGIPIGNSVSLTGLAPQVNTITGSSFSGSTVNLPEGTYLVNVSFEFGNATAGCPALGFSIHSYYIDFPVTGRIHANSPSNCGGTSNHAAQWTTTVIVGPGGLGWSLELGRGQGGNYTSGGSSTGSVDLFGSSRIVIQKIL